MAFEPVRSICVHLRFQFLSYASQGCRSWLARPPDEAADGVLRLDFDRRLTLQFRGAVVTSDGGLLAYRELDGALGLRVMAGRMLADACTGKNGQHALVGMLRQAVFGRLAGYADVNDAERLRQHETGQGHTLQGQFTGGGRPTAKENGHIILLSGSLGIWEGAGDRHRAIPLWKSRKSANLHIK